MAAPTLPITPPGVITQEFRSPLAVRRGIIAGVVGNMLEWYDFALFGFRRPRSHARSDTGPPAPLGGG